MEKKLTIRKAILTDIDDLHLCNKKNLPVFYTSEQYLFFLLTTSFDVIVGTINGKIEGYILGEFSVQPTTNKKNFHIMSIAVNQNYRKMGVGSNMLKYLINNVTNKCDTMTLYVHVENKNAILFYLKNNFKIIKKLPNYYQETFKDCTSSDAVKMLLNLK